MQENPSSETELKIVEPQDPDSEDATYDLFTYPADFTLEVLHQKLSVNKDIVIPRFQRKFVWSVVQASRLVESFLLGLPVPPVFLYGERNSDKLLVVDGQQRLRSVSYYFSGFFGEEEAGKRSVFRLKLGEKSKWDGLSIADLKPEDRSKLKNGVLRSYVMKQTNADDNKSIFYAFERLNTGGTLLAPQEVRNSIYGGRFNDLLHELNKRESWRKILGKEMPDTRLKDLELLLRFFALTTNLNIYDKPMREFLTNFMIRSRQESNPTLKNMFELTTDAVFKYLGAKPFHIKAGLNAAVFDAVLVAFALRTSPFRMT